MASPGERPSPGQTQSLPALRLPARRRRAHASAWRPGAATPTAQKRASEGVTTLTICRRHHFAGTPEATASNPSKDGGSGPN